MDYEYEFETVTSFKMVVCDWGTAWFSGLTARINSKVTEFLGGTPGYAGPGTFDEMGPRDLFSFGRIALDIAMDKAGKMLICLKYS